MKKILLSFVAFLLMALTAFAQDNLLANAGFESWTDGKADGWVPTTSATNGTVTQSTDAHTGSYAASLAGSSKNKRMASQEYVLEAGTYSYSVWAKGGANIRLGYAIVQEDGTIDSKNGYNRPNLI